MTTNLKDHDVYLMLDGETVFPFSSHGFHFAQGKLTNVKQRSANAIFLSADGDVFQIENIAALCNDLAAKALRLLGIGYAIRAELQPHPVELSDLKTRVAVAMSGYAAEEAQDESWPFAMRPPAEVTSAIMNAESASALYAILDLPGPEDCLDLL